MLFLGTLSLLTYLVLRPSSSLATVGWLPGGLTEWADSHPHLRHLAGFAAMAAPGFLLPRIFPSRRSSLRIGRLVSFFGIVLVLEVAQLWVPTRGFHWMDIVAGGMGVLIIWAGIAFGQHCLWRMQGGRGPRAMESGNV